LALVLALLVPALAQETPTESEVYFERVAVDIVNVEVYVSDKQGNPVLGLTADDFEVTEDERPVEIVNFFSVAEGRADRGVGRAGAEPSGTIPPEGTAPPGLPRMGTAEEALPESQRLHLIVYVDNFNIHPLNRNQAFWRLRTFLSDTIEPGDRAMVASYDRSLQIRQPFTESPETVNRVLIDLEKVSAMGNERESERAAALKEIYETKSVHVAQFQAKTFAENQYHEIDSALDSLREMLDSLGGLPGRKMLIHLSDGIPMVPGQDLYQAIQQRFADISALGEAFSRDLSRRYLEIVAQANSNRISFYTIDAGGLRTRSWMGAENTTINSQIPVAMAVDGIRASNLQSTLRLMANRTGGQSILNTNDISEGLRRIAQDFDNFYSLGYRAPHVNPGRYHTIEVRLKSANSEWSVRHREGYRDKSIGAQIEDSTRAFLIHGYETNPLGVSIDLGEPQPTDDGMASIPIRVRVPVARIVLMPRGAYYEGRLKLYFGASDETGRDAVLQELPFEIRIPESSLEMAKQDEVARVIEAKIRPGPHQVVVVVLDEVSQERSVLGRFVTVGTPRS
jgi:VWFA-related protein